MAFDHLSKDAAETVANVANTTSFGGAAGAVYFGLTAVDLCAFVGAAVAIIGLLVNAYFKNRALQIMQDSLKAHRRDDIPEALKKINEHSD